MIGENTCMGMDSESPSVMRRKSWMARCGQQYNMTNECTSHTLSLFCTCQQRCHGRKVSSEFRHSFVYGHIHNFRQQKLLTSSSNTYTTVSITCIFLTPSTESETVSDYVRISYHSQATQHQQVQLPAIKVESRAAVQNREP